VVDLLRFYQARTSTRRFARFETTSGAADFVELFRGFEM